MAFDGIFIHPLVKELKNKLINGRVDKIHQPEKDELSIQIRSSGENYMFFVSAESSMPYFTLTEGKKQNPSDPPMFCMLLRKHLTSGKILNIEQMGNERVVRFTIESRNELGDIEEKYLLIEIMGKHSNIILTHSNYTIIDSIKRITPFMSRVRTILPGVQYTDLPKVKVTLSESSLLPFPETMGETLVLKALYQHYEGFSPSLSQYLLSRSGIYHDIKVKELTSNEYERLNSQLITLLHQLNSDHFKGYLYHCPEDKKEFYFISDFLPHCDSESFDSLCQMLDRYFNQKNKSLKIHQRTASLKKHLLQMKERFESKCLKLRKEIEVAEKANAYQMTGDLLLSNLHLVKKGDSSVTVLNFFEDPVKEIEIQLDPLLDPSQNAQKYFKKYNKLKTAQHILKDQILEAESEISYLDQVLTNLEYSESSEDIQEIRQELFEQGIIKKKVFLQKKKKTKNVFFRSFKSSEGYEILVGKNNHANDQLTLKMSSNKDVWLHTKIIPGSHVVIKTQGETVPEQTLLEAAKIAAYYSKARQSANVPVDYTLVKNVQKPNGSKPGMVIYTQEKTLYVTPDEDLINKLFIN